MPTTSVTARHDSAISMLRKMVCEYKFQTSTIHRSVSPLRTPTKKFVVNPAMIDMITGTIRKAQASNVKPSWI